MHKITLLFVSIALLGVLVIGCSSRDNADVSLVGDRASAPPQQGSSSSSGVEGGLPTPFTPESMREISERIPYGREWEEVDYNAISKEEYRIRSVIEFSQIKSSQNDTGDDVIIKGIAKYGVEKYYAIGDVPAFLDVDDMETVLKNKDFLEDFVKNTNTVFEPESYSVPAKIETDVFSATLVALDGTPHFQMYGRKMSGDGDYYSAVWAVFSVANPPKAIEIAQFYADLNDLTLVISNGSVGPVCYFTSQNGGSFFEKFSIETNEPATAYIWEQDNVIGVIILPGEHKPENLDLCVLEKHEL